MFKAFLPLTTCERSPLLSAGRVTALSEVELVLALENSVFRPDTDKGLWAGLSRLVDFLSYRAWTGFTIACWLGLICKAESSLMGFTPMVVLLTSPKTFRFAPAARPCVAGTPVRAGLDLFR